MLVPSSTQAAGWHQQAFGGKVVSAVSINGRNHAMVAAVADGSLYLSTDGGSTWLPSLVPSPVHLVAYDPVYSGRLFVGTANGIYASDNGGLNWRAFGDVSMSRKSVTALVVSDEYIYAGMYNGAGTAVRLMRFARDGAVQDMNLPSNNLAALEYDLSRRKLYAGAAGGVYSSDDQGLSWFGGGRGAGQFTLGVVSKPGLLWQASADGLFRSNDDGASWNKLAGPANLNGTYYGQDMHISGLAVSGNQAFYGSWSISFPYRFLVQYDGSAAHSVLDVRIYAVAAAGTYVWAASENGLWVNDVQAANQPHVQRPAVIIPGILGSMPTAASLAAYLPRTAMGWWDPSYQTPFVLDPFGHGFDGLLAAMEARGYQYNTTLFVFPYNWMQDNQRTAMQLATKLADIRKVCLCSQVDIISHSMGGLVARAYIQSSSYHNDVQNLIQLGTPNAGSVNSYAPWEAGSYPSYSPSFDSQMLNVVVSAMITSDQTAESRVQLVHQAVPSLGQLLPVFNYLEGRSYPMGYPTNPFLEQLNLPAVVNALKQRAVVFTVGSGSRPTTTGLTVGPERSGAVVWPHGEVQASSNGPGDEVVPLASLESLAKPSTVLDADHLTLISAAAPFILQTLLGEYVPDTAEPPLPPQRSLTVYANGPVALQITDSSGRSLNDVTLGIPGSYYSGSQIHPQLAVIPNYRNEDYTISAEATGNGWYSLGVAEIAGEGEPGSGKESRVEADAVAGANYTYHYDPGTDRLNAAYSPTNAPTNTPPNAQVGLPNELPAATKPSIPSLHIPTSSAGEPNDLLSLHQPLSEMNQALAKSLYTAQHGAAILHLPSIAARGSNHHSLVHAPLGAPGLPWFPLVLTTIFIALVLYLLVKH